MIIYRYAKSYKHFFQDKNWVWKFDWAPSTDPSCGGTYNHSKQSLKCTQQKTMTSVTQVHLEDHLDVALHYARTKVTSLLHRLLILNMYANYGIIHTSLNPISQPGSLCPLPDAGSARRRRIQAACQISCPQVGGPPEFSIVCCPGRGWDGAW